MDTMGIMLRLTTRPFRAEQVMPRRWPKARQLFHNLERHGWRIRTATRRNHLLWTQSGPFRNGTHRIIVLPDDPLPWLYGCHAEQCLVLALLRIFQVKERSRGQIASATTVPALSLAFHAAHRIMNAAIPPPSTTPPGCPRC